MAEKVKPFQIWALALAIYTLAFAVLIIGTKRSEPPIIVHISPEVIEHIAPIAPVENYHPVSPRERALYNLAAMMDPSTQ